MKHLAAKLTLLWTLGWTLACIHMPTRTAYQTDGAPLDPDADQFVGYGGSLFSTVDGETGGVVDAGIAYHHALAPHVALGVDLNTLQGGLWAAGPRLTLNTAASAAEPLALESSLGLQLGYQGLMVGAADGTAVLRINPGARVDGFSGQIGVRANPVLGGFGLFLWGNAGLGVAYAAPPGPHRQFVVGLEASRFALLTGDATVDVLDQELAFGSTGFWGAQIHVRTRRSPGP